MSAVLRAHRSNEHFTVDGTLIEAWADGPVFGREQENRIAELRRRRGKKRVLRIGNRTGRRRFAFHTRWRRNGGRSSGTPSLSTRLFIDGGRPGSRQPGSGKEKYHRCGKTAVHSIPKLPTSHAGRSSWALA